MTRSEIVERVASMRPDVPHPVVERVVAAMFDHIAQTLQRGGRVELRGFGRFSVRIRKACATKNPRTGVAVEVPERRAVAFAVGKELKARINRQVFVRTLPLSERAASPSQRAVG